MKSLIKTILITTLLSLTISCTPREMYLSDPLVNIEDSNIKKVLFIGFNYSKDIKLSSESKNLLNQNLEKEFQKFEGIKINRLDDNDYNEISGKVLNSDDIKKYIDKYKCDLVIVGFVSDYSEIKYLDQPTPVIYPDGSFNNTNNSSSNVSTVRIQVSIDGGIYFIGNNNKVIWSQPITDYESVQFDDGRLNTQSFSDNDKDITLKLKYKLLNNTVFKIMKNLLPYYSYK